MFHKLLLLAGDLAEDAPVNPTNTEPYRVIWNTSVLFNDQSRYLSQDGIPGFSSTVLNTAVLTDYAPLDYEPIMFMRDLIPLDTSILGVPILTATRPRYPITGMRINNIVDIAHADRRNKLPKAFDFRFISTDIFDEMDLIRYNLNSSGSRYICLRIKRENGVLTAQIKECADGNNIGLSDPYVFPDDVTNTFGTETISFVIFGDHLELRLDDPGTQVLTYDLPAPLMVEANASLELFREDPNPEGQDTPVIYGIDGLYIYDAYL